MSVRVCFVFSRSYRLGRTLHIPCFVGPHSSILSSGSGLSNIALQQVLEPFDTCDFFFLLATHQGLFHGFETLSLAAIGTSGICRWGQEQCMLLIGSKYCVIICHPMQHKCSVFTNCITTLGDILCRLCLTAPILSLGLLSRWNLSCSRHVCVFLPGSQGFTSQVVDCYARCIPLGVNEYINAYAQFPANDWHPIQVYSCLPPNIPGVGGLYPTSHLSHQICKT